VEGYCWAITQDASRSAAADRFLLYSDTAANEDNSFRNHIRYPKSSLAETAYVIRHVTSRCLERKQRSRVGGSPSPM